MNLMKKTLQEGLPSLSLALDEQRCEKLCAFGAAMVKQNEVMNLTGITEDMLKGAPKIEEVLPKFLEFVGDRVLVAHNSDFDTGFIRAECHRQGLAYTLTSADTLILSQNLLSHLNKFKLNIVSNALSLPLSLIHI